MRLSLAAVAAELGTGRDVPAGVFAAGASIDTRSLAAGDLFFAVAGERRDGHEFVAEAFVQGAAGAVVRREWTPKPGAPVGPLFRTDDPVRALADLARAARRAWGGQVVAVTGSNGKTTTKDAAAALLATARRTAKTLGNLNNELGVPLTLLRIPDEAEVAVVEMGMNHAGEIRRLARIAEPDVGVVTNVSEAHVGFFGSVREVALAKRELIEELGPAGRAVLNADDRLVRGFARVHAGPTTTFGRAPRADFRVLRIRGDWKGLAFTLRRADGREPLRFESPLIGRHNVWNLAAALAAAAALGVDPATLREAVANFGPAAMRGEVVEIGGVKILNDCYNSNPGGLRAALDALSSADGARKIAALGEMLELGEASAELHRRGGAAAAAAGVDLLIGVRGDARRLVEGAVEAGLPVDRTLFFDDAAEAGDALARLTRPGDALLLKGSRGVGMERALERLRAASNERGGR